MADNINSEDHIDPTVELSLETVKKQAIKGIVLLTSRTFVLQLIALVATFLLTVFLSPSQYGTFFLVSAVINFFAYFSDVGLAPALIQKKERLTEEDLKTTFTIQQALVLTLVLLVFALTPFVQGFYKINQDSVYLFWALAFSLFLSSLKTIPSIILERKLDFGKLVIPQLVEALLFNIVAVYLAWKGYGITSFTIAVLVRGIAGLILMYIIQPWKIGFAFSKSSFRSLFKYGLPYQGNTLLAVIKDDAMTAMLGGILGASGIGLLGWAQKWAAAPLRFFMDQVIKVTFPAYSRMQEEKGELSRAVSKSIFFVCLIVFPSLAMLMTLAPILTQVIPKYGKWQPALLALTILSLNSAMAAVTTPLTNLLNAIGRITTTFKLMIMWTVLTWILVPLFALMYGLTGVAVAYLLVGSSSIIAIKVASQYVDISMWNSIGKPLLASTLMGVVVWFFSSLVPVSIIGVIMLIIIGVVLYSSLIFSFVGKSLVMDLKKFIRLAVVLVLMVSIFTQVVPVQAQTPETSEQSKSYVSIVNPIRGEDYWDLPNQKIGTAVEGQKQILEKNNVPVTWLVRFDAFKDAGVVETVKTTKNSEVGILLEVIPSWTSKAGVNYQTSATWHKAASVFLTAYTPSDRIKLIDTAFEQFKTTFGSYPKSVGAWYIDSYSLSYMQQKYGITTALIVADQFTTDDYQVWGQYWSSPYYPSKRNTLTPAQDKESKIPLVIVQWAARDPINGYGGGVNESTYSVQPNDYIDYHNLDSSYFARLVDIYTKQKLNKINQIVVGLENSYDWNRYKDEYAKQIEVLVTKQNSGQLSLNTMKDFADVYQKTFPSISPEHIIVADDPLGTEKKVVWFMDPFYRTGWFYSRYGSAFRDIRQYVLGEEEPCYNRICKAINFATFSTRVLDEVTYHQKMLVDIGSIHDLSIEKQKDGYLLSYKNDADKIRKIGFLPRDISIDGVVKSIDAWILEVQNKKTDEKVSIIKDKSELYTQYKTSTTDLLVNALKFLGVLLAFSIPGFVIAGKMKLHSLKQTTFLGVVFGLCLVPLIAYLTGFINFSLAVPIVLLGSLIYMLIFKQFTFLREVKLSVSWIGVFATIVIILGTIFQVVGVARSGWVYSFGVGFLGPTGHDMVWHQSLVEALVKKVPPESPIFSGTTLTNYHYFYDLLVAETTKISAIPIDDLIYRFYPVLFSLLLGLGTYLLVVKVFKSRLGALFALLFVYFGGSFGYVVEYIKRATLWGGESAFWANQPVSINLNPPFAISLIVLVAVLLSLQLFLARKDLLSGVLLVIFSGVLIEFKVYAGVLVLGALFLIAIYQAIFQKSIDLIKVFVITFVLSLIVFLPQNISAGELLVFSPFWFVHTMIEFSDRVGWEKLSAARQAYFERGEWFKVVLAEGLAFVIFLGGNLGTRVISFGALAIFIKRKMWRDLWAVFFLLVIVASLTIPLVFIQKGNPWNTIQFSYYALYLLAVLAGLVLAFLVKKLPRIVSVGIIVVILVLTPISSFATFRSYFGEYPQAILPLTELDGLNFLKNQPEGVVLKYPYELDTKSRFLEPFPLFAYETTAYVSAYSYKPSYIEDEIQHEIFQNNYPKRYASAWEFFNKKDFQWSNNFLKENNISYIYLPRAYKVELSEQDLNIKKIFENEDVYIFKTIQ